MQVNGYSEKVIPLILFVVGEVTLSQDKPLSVDLRMFPDKPIPTKVLFPKVIPLRLFAVGEVTLSKDAPLSVDLTMVPDVPTTTNIPGTDVVVVVAVEEDLDFAQEETRTAILTINTNQDNIIFILFLIIKCCKIKTTHS